MLVCSRRPCDRQDIDSPGSRGILSAEEISSNFFIKEPGDNPKIKNGNQAGVSIVRHFPGLWCFGIAAPRLSLRSTRDRGPLQWVSFLSFATRHITSIIASDSIRRANLHKGPHAPSSWNSPFFPSVSHARKIELGAPSEQQLASAFSKYKNRNQLPTSHSLELNLGTEPPVAPVIGFN